MAVGWIPRGAADRQAGRDGHGGLPRWSQGWRGGGTAVGCGWPFPTADCKPERRGGRRGLQRRGRRHGEAWTAEVGKQSRGGPERRGGRRREARRTSGWAGRRGGRANAAAMDWEGRDREVTRRTRANLSRRAWFFPARFRAAPRANLAPASRFRARGNRANDFRQVTRAFLAITRGRAITHSIKHVQRLNARLSCNRRVYPACNA